MASELYVSADLTTKTRIRDAALAVIAECGLGRTSVRAIAQRAGVSPALVLHHFGSKQGVYDEVAAWALEVLGSATRDADRGADPADAHEQRQAAMDSLLDRVPQLGGYLRQLLLDPSPEGVNWFREAVRSTTADLERREQEGRARPSTDVQAEAAMLLILSMAPVMLGPLLDAALDTDVAAPVGRQRWRAVQTEMLTSALYPTSGPG
jgi:AcrR family transcriptional regulator